MSLIDFDGITRGLATRFDAANVTPPANYQNIRSSSAYGPNGAPAAPFVIVNPPESGRATFGGQERSAVHEFTVDFFGEGAADQARTAEMITRWLQVLFDQTLTGTQLGGLLGVALSWTGRYETGTMTYGDSEFPGIRLFVSVTTTDGISPTA